MSNYKENISSFILLTYPSMMMRAMTRLKRRLQGEPSWRGGEVMLGSERLLFTLGRYNSGNWGPPLLQRRWGGTAKNSFSVVLLAAPTVVMMNISKMFPTVPFGGILMTVFLLTLAVPPRINNR